MCKNLWIFYIVDLITSFDFDPSGERAATIDYAGVCLISDITTNDYTFHLNMDGGSGK